MLPPKLYTLSLHDALPISCRTFFTRLPCQSASRLKAARRAKGASRTDSVESQTSFEAQGFHGINRGSAPRRDRKSTRLNSSHTVISYAVFCLKKKSATAGG